MARAIDVARYLIKLAESEAEPDYLSNMRLQKLLYYVQGWSLALRGKPMFPDRIEAWAHGPVVPEVYRIFKKDFRPILPEDAGEPRGLGRADCRFIRQVWRTYRDYSATSLREMTHGEAPWRETRGDCDPSERCNREITRSAMKSFFGKLARES